MGSRADAGPFSSARKLNQAQVAALETRRSELLAILDQAVAPVRIARALHVVGLTAGDLATATGAHERTVSSWLDESRPEPKLVKHQERLRETKRVTRLVVEDGTLAYQEADWLRDPHLGADLQTPLALIGEGKWREAGRLYCADVSIRIPALFAPADRENRAGQTSSEISAT